MACRRFATCVPLNSSRRPRLASAAALGCLVLSVTWACQAAAPTADPTPVELGRSLAPPATSTRGAGSSFAEAAATATAFAATHPLSPSPPATLGATAPAAGPTPLSRFATAAPARSCAITAAQIPQQPGSIWDEEVRVGVSGVTSISAAGPWDLSAVPGAPASARHTLLARAQAPNGSEFPSASYVLQNEIEGSAGATIPNKFRFYEIRSDGIYWIGDSNGSAAFKPESPQRFQTLPTTPGQRWETTYRDSRAQNAEIRSALEITGCGPLATAYGRFETALLLKLTSAIPALNSVSTSFSWLVADIGQVASITMNSGVPNQATVAITRAFKPG